MRYHQMLIPTLKEVPAEAVVASHQLLLRAGFIRKLAAGIYNLLPMGVRVVKKVETIIREELNRAGAQEVLMAAVQPAELWIESGRWSQYGPELLRFEDRKGGSFCFGPTHEEVITDIVRKEIRSYRQLPLNLYQIQVKFRDEIRPRFGLMRGREFLMKDAYSFDVDAEHARESYNVMYEAYRRIFTRCGLSFRAVEADTGNIGGTLSHEFQVLAQSGEDEILSCNTCDYAANVEKAELKPSAFEPPDPGAFEPSAKVATPGRKTVDEVTSFLQVPADRLVKTLIYVADGKPVAVLVRGDHELNPLKLKQVLGAQDVELAPDDVVANVTQAPPGFAGPVGLGLDLLIDPAVQGVTNAVVGANEIDAHLTNVNLGRDYHAAQTVDLRLAQAGDECPRCHRGRYESHRGIEVGHIFYLGTKYSEAMRATYLDTDGKENPIAMGCYGIGVTRTMAASIEQHHDENGMSWPMSLAPFQVTVLPLQLRDEAVVAAAEEIYRALLAAGVEVLLDDRDERPGSKFKDADLLGIPLRVTVARKSLADGNVEVKRRGETDFALIPVGEAAAHCATRVREELEELK